MKIVELFSEECIDMDLHAHDKWQAIHELSLLFLSAGRINAIDEYEKAVHQREKEVSTGVGFGIGIPHGKSSAVLQPSIAFGKSKAGVDFDAIDHEPVYLVFLMAVPATVDDKTYLQTLASLARLIVHEDFRQQLLDAGTKEDVLTVFQSYQDINSINL
jgi:fructose-specific phosphotransferase system IIA component